MKKETNKKITKKEINQYEGKKYIIRCDRAGVFFGEIASRNGQEVKIKNARRLWYWAGACSLSELAKSGVQQPNSCKFTVTVEEIEVLDAIEIIECTQKAVKSIDNVKEWKY